MSTNRIACPPSVPKYIVPKDIVLMGIAERALCRTWCYYDFILINITMGVRKVSKKITDEFDGI